MLNKEADLLYTAGYGGRLSSSQQGVGREQSQAVKSWRRKLWLVVSTYTVNIPTEIRSFCHSHGRQALGFLTWSCSCQRHTFIQGFLGSPHFLSVQALIPTPLCYFTLGRCTVSNYLSWKSICRNPLMALKQIWPKDEFMQKLEGGSKGATIVLESDREREWRLPSSCLLLPALLRSCQNQQHPTAHTGKLGHQPSGATIIENNVSRQHPYAVLLWWDLSTFSGPL